MGGSTDEAGLFEFDQLSDSDDDDTDPPDEPDPPDGDGADENAPMGRAAKRERSKAASSGADGKTRNSDPTDPPDDVDETSNEPMKVASTTSGESAEGGSTDDGSASSGGGLSNDNSGNDAPDPPDPSDGSIGASDSRFYEFNPVEESQAAFNYAEKQSRAAAKSAYKHAAGSLIGRYIRKYTSPDVRKRLDEVFSRRMLGSVLVGGAFSKILETSVELYFGAASVWRPVMWAIIFIVSTTIFVWWERLAHRATEAATQAAEKASETAEKASQAAEKASEAASETAEKATEAAAEAAGEPTPEQKTAEVVGAGVAQATQNRKGGSTAATRAGGKRPTAVRSRARTAERRPNKRFENESEGSVPYDEVIGDSENESAEPVFEGSGFQDPGDAEEL